MTSRRLPAVDRRDGSSGAGVESVGVGRVADADPTSAVACPFFIVGRESDDSSRAIVSCDRLVRSSRAIASSMSTTISCATGATTGATTGVTVGVKIPRVAYRLFCWM